MTARRRARDRVDDNRRVSHDARAGNRTRLISVRRSIPPARICQLSASLPGAMLRLWSCVKLADVAYHPNQERISSRRQTSTCRRPDAVHGEVLVDTAPGRAGSNPTAPPMITDAALEVI